MVSVVDHGVAGRAAAAAAAYRRLQQGRLAFVAVLAALLALAFLADLATGPSSLGMGEALATLVDPAGAERPLRAIVWDVRLPQALMALLVGASLALAGAEMQTVFNNPLASPFTLGISSAAAFGAAAAIVLGVAIPGVPEAWIISANAFVFAFAAVLLLQVLARLRGTGTESLVLFGIALVFSCNAAVALMEFMANEQALQQLVFWTMGSLNRTNWQKLAALAIVLAAMLPLSFASAWRLTALRMGDERALSAGVDVERLRLTSLLRVAVLTATAVAFVGTIGFVGLIAPHMARLMVGEDHRFFLGASALTGALVMALASIASKLVVPGVLVPVGIVTALIGVPVFVALIFTRRVGA